MQLGAEFFWYYTYEVEPCTKFTNFCDAKFTNSTIPYDVGTLEIGQCMGGNSVCASVCALTDFLIAVQLVHVCRSCPSTSLARLRFIRISGHTIGQEVGYLVSIPFADLVLSVHYG